MWRQPWWCWLWGFSPFPPLHLLFSQFIPCHHRWEIHCLPLSFFSPVHHLSFLWLIDWWYSDMIPVDYHQKKYWFPDSLFSFHLRIWCDVHNPPDDWMQSFLRWWNSNKDLLLYVSRWWCSCWWFGLSSSFRFFRRVMRWEMFSFSFYFAPWCFLSTIHGSISTTWLFIRIIVALLLHHDDHYDVLCCNPFSAPFCFRPLFKRDDLDEDKDLFHAPHQIKRGGFHRLNPNKCNSSGRDHILESLSLLLFFKMMQVDNRFSWWALL